MNPNAFEIIEKLGLVHPRFYNLDEIVQSQCSKFYLRYSKSSDKESYVIDKRELLDKIDTLKWDIQSGALTKIEDSFDSVAGCAAYINPDGIYGEYVSGHIISLLRRGLCNKRFYIGKDKGVKVKDAFQGFEAIQLKGGYDWKPCLNRLDKLGSVIRYLSDCVLENQTDLLLEILITENAIIVCDAKYPKMEQSWKEIKKMFDDEFSGLFLKKRKTTKTCQEQVKIDGLDIDLSCFVENVLIGNGAILSHYITRNYSKFNSIKAI